MNIEKIIETITYFITTYSMKLVAALLVLWIGKWLANKIAKLIVKLLEKNNVDVTLIKFFESIIYYALMVVVIIAAAGQLGINTTSFLTIVGAAGLAIGLALLVCLTAFSCRFSLGCIYVLAVSPYILED